MQVAPSVDDFVDQPMTARSRVTHEVANCCPNAFSETPAGDDCSTVCGFGNTVEPSLAARLDDNEAAAAEDLVRP